MVDPSWRTRASEVAIDVSWLWLLSATIILSFSMARIILWGKSCTDHCCSITEGWLQVAARCGRVCKSAVTPRVNLDLCRMRPGQHHCLQHSRLQQGATGSAYVC